MNVMDLSNSRFHEAVTFGKVKTKTFDLRITDCLLLLLLSFVCKYLCSSDFFLAIVFFKIHPSKA